MAHLLERIAAAGEAVVRWVGHVTAWLGFALVLLVSANVLGRYFLGLGSVGMQEAEWHVLAAGALFGMSYGLNQGGEVRVDVFYENFSPRTKAAVDTVAGTLMCLCCLALVWLSIPYVGQSYSINEGSPDPGGLSHRYLLKSLIPIAFALLALQAFSMALKSLANLVSPRPDEGGEEDAAKLAHRKPS